MPVINNLITIKSLPETGNEEKKIKRKKMKVDLA